MTKLCAFFSIAALSASILWTIAPACAQTKSFTAPTRGLANPFGATSAISGQARPLGGIPAPAYGTGRRGHGGRAYGGYGFATYVPNYWDVVGDPAGGPYSYTWPSYGAPAEAPPGAVMGPGSGPASGPPPPPVIINQYFGYPPPPPGVDTQAEGAARPGDPLTEPENYYLIVYRDHSIHAALAYWVEGNTLHYVTTDNAHNQVSLDLVDVATSTRLNSDHNVPFSVAGK
jgi:hypothetical protein